MCHIDARTVIVIVGSVLPYGTLRIRFGPIETLVVRAVAAPEIVGVVGEVERRTADRCDRAGACGSGGGRQRHCGVA